MSVWLVKPDVLRPGRVGTRGSMIIRLHGHAQAEYTPLAPAPPPPPPSLFCTHIVRDKLLGIRVKKSHRRFRRSFWRLFVQSRNASERFPGDRLQRPPPPTR